MNTILSNYYERFRCENHKYGRYLIQRNRDKDLWIAEENTVTKHTKYH